MKQRHGGAERGLVAEEAQLIGQRADKRPRDPAARLNVHAGVVEEAQDQAQQQTQHEESSSGRQDDQPETPPLALALERGVVQLLGRDAIEASQREDREKCRAAPDVVQGDRDDSPDVFPGEIRKRPADRQQVHCVEGVKGGRHQPVERNSGECRREHPRDEQGEEHQSSSSAELPQRQGHADPEYQAHR